jgi:hypothetical protein
MIYKEFTQTVQEKIKPKNQSFDETMGKVIDTTNMVNRTPGLNLSLENLFQSKTKTIYLIIGIVI